MRVRSFRPEVVATTVELVLGADFADVFEVRGVGRSPAGLRNHGWKDSGDAIVNADGSLAQEPIALVEAQGYVYEAKLRIADVYNALGEDDLATPLRAEAGALRAAFNDAFWDPEEGFFALALDGRKRQVRSISSNLGHCLSCGIVDDDKAALVAERMMAPDMFSGRGVRTLASSSRAYNPMSYHNGSVWPHDRHGTSACPNCSAAFTATNPDRSSPTPSPASPRSGPRLRRSCSCSH